MTEKPIVYFLSYDGLTDSLGRSQILPYVQGLSKNNEITVISFDKEETFKLDEKNVRDSLSESVGWISLKYHKSPPVLSTLYDLYLLKREVKRVIKDQKINIIHCRSYVTSLVGLWAKRTYGVKFIFDMRGFWADERVEGGLWNLSNPIFRMIYRYFKKMERQFLQEADAVISLTNNAKNEIEHWDWNPKELKGISEKITVIPTCTDLEHFHPDRIDQERLRKIQDDLVIQPDDFVLLYLGSLGTWYMLEEMLDFYDILRTRIIKSRFLFVSPDQEVLKKAIVSRNYNPNEIISTSSSRKDVPLFISLSSCSIFFIKPTYSKKASAATKMGEIMAMGKPVITNTGWGDVDDVLLKTKAGLIVKGFNQVAYEETIQSIISFSSSPEAIRHHAEEYFSLEKGIAAYNRVYQGIYTSSGK